MVVILMGVTACGKTTVGIALAQREHWTFIDADDFHSQANKEKMHAGIPLTDEDRAPWLAALHTQMAAWISSEANVALACSALKQEYRDTMLAGLAPQSVKFVFLDGPLAVIQERLAHRTGHFMSPTLLSSQIATLEIPADALRVSIDQTVPAIVQDIVNGLCLVPDTAADATH